MADQVHSPEHVQRRKLAHQRVADRHEEAARFRDRAAERYDSRGDLKRADGARREAALQRERAATVRDKPDSET